MAASPSDRRKADESGARLADQISGILRCGVTRTALRTPRDMTLDDVVENLHLFERLYIAAMLVKQRRDYSGGLTRIYLRLGDAVVMCGCGKRVIVWR